MADGSKQVAVLDAVGGSTVDPPHRLRAPAEVRQLAADRRLAAPTPARLLGRLAAIAALYLALFAAGMVVDRWWVWVPVWSAQAFLLLACGAVMHEGVHGNLTGNRGVDRALAFLGGWLIFLPTAAYRPYHLQHHATTISADDPSGANAKPFRHRREYLLVMALAGPGFTAQLWWIAARTLAGRAPAYISQRYRRQIRTECTLAILGYLAVAPVSAALGFGRPVMLAWVMPAVLGLCAVAPFILMPEHYGAPEDQPVLRSTATVRSNRAVAFVYLNNNHHAAHHLVASCNPLRLGEITDLVEDRTELRHRSYTGFHRDVFRSLRW